MLSSYVENVMIKGLMQSLDQLELLRQSRCYQICSRLLRPTDNNGKLIPTNEWYQFIDLLSSRKNTVEQYV